MATMDRYFKPVTLTDTTTSHSRPVFRGCRWWIISKAIRGELPDLVNVLDLTFKVQLGGATRIKAPSGKNSILHGSYLSARMKCNYFFLAL